MIEGRVDGKRMRGGQRTKMLDMNERKHPKINRMVKDGITDMSH